MCVVQDIVSVRLNLWIDIICILKLLYHYYFTCYSSLCKSVRARVLIFPLVHALPWQQVAGCLVIISGSLISSNYLYIIILGTLNTTTPSYHITELGICRTQNCLNLYCYLIHVHLNPS